MQRKDDSTDDLLCSFCGKSQDEVKKLIAGPSVYICDECIQLCNEIIAEEYGQDDEDDSEDGLLKPYEIKETLDQYVIEQERPKKILSVAVHNHYKRIDAPEDDDWEEQIQHVIRFFKALNWRRLAAADELIAATLPHSEDGQRDFETVNGRRSHALPPETTYWALADETRRTITPFSPSSSDSLTPLRIGVAPPRTAL